MFQKKTVFVVGAGASAEFDMPTGDTLKNDIADLLSRKNANQNGDPHTTFRAVMMATLGKTERQAFSEPGFHLAAALPSFVSIDEALHYFSSDDKIVKIGKLATAYILLKYERGSTIAPASHSGRSDVSRCSHTWLAELFSMSLSFAKREAVKDAFENIHFINFNYDRVIETYIATALQTLGGLTAPSAEKIAATLNMVRAYGDLGPLPIADPRGIPFGFNPYDQGNRLEEIANRIRTYTEQEGDPSIRQKIGGLMREAELVVFVGFGFHQQNVALLRSSGRSKPVFATAYKIDKDNYGLFSQNLTEFFGDNVKFFDKKGCELLKDLRPTISAAAAI